ncbi:MAG: prepilin-type N-terminal cleavage/methylation domain-containing protein [Patescibacteria group bacterium]
MKNFLRQKNKNNRASASDRSNRDGFTLVETLVAVSIFTVSILAMIAVLSNGIADTNYAKKKAIAGYLAQEGIEYMRNMRDTYVLYTVPAQAGWTAFNNNLIDASACQSANGCYFGDLSATDFSNPTQPMIGIVITPCGTNCPTMLYDATTGKYNYTTGTSSGYIRKIWITPANPINETKVVSKVSWTQGSGTYNIIFSANLFNWVE